ncbi:MAG TPA: DUF1559 domain-containing protein, partial [Pirellulaceae bacterium]|nr:DUF1559 domain-containing protein [Pirellulaceae bacterium]
MWIQHLQVRKAISIRQLGPLRPAFTLIELLVVIAVIGILMAIAIPAIQSVRRSAERTTCANQLRQIGVGLLSYQSTHKHFPPGIVSDDAHLNRFPRGTFLVHLLPHVEQDNLFKTVQEDWQATGSPFIGHIGFQSVIPLYQCPSDPRSGQPQWTHEGRLVGLTSYVGVAGTNYMTRDGVLFVNSRIRGSEIRDGLSHTLLLGERPASTDNWYGWWYAGTGQMHDGLPSGSPDMLLGALERNDATTYDAA